MFDFEQPDFEFDGDMTDNPMDGSAADGMPDGLMGFSLDLDGDGQPDLTYLDMDNDGNPDQILMDTDGDGILDTVGADTNGDGIPDYLESVQDADNDGVPDTVIKANDYDQDGVTDDITTYSDVDGDGTFDVVSKAFDADHDGVMDNATSYVDEDGDGLPDQIFREELLDRDGDGVIDTYKMSYDEDGDRAFEAVNVFNVDTVSGEIVLQAVDEGHFAGVAGTFAEDLDNFDPDTADMDAVSGDPASAMEKWEYQGNTDRCALYSQKFVIEELTNQELDIEKIADFAEQNGWFNENGGTAALNMNKVLDAFGIENEMRFNCSISDIEDSLNAGNKVIVSVDSDEIWYGADSELFTPSQSSDHAVQVIGIDHTNPDEPMVILNDSGNRDGCGEMVPMDVFASAWDAGNCQMIIC